MVHINSDFTQPSTKMYLN